MSSWIKGAIGILGFFGIILGYALQVTHLSGYLDLAGLIKNGLLLGSLLGGITGFLLHKKGKDQDARFSIYAGMLVLGVVIGPLLLTLVNRISSSPPAPVEYKLLSVKSVMGSRVGAVAGQDFNPDAHLINIQKEEKTYQIKIGPDLDQYILDDDSIILNIRKGVLGYDYVDHSKTDRVI